jgi:heme-degrading monooxygenase HmoA
MWYLPEFIWRSVRSLSQARKADGCVAATVRNQPGLVFWTRTVWHDMEAMRAFMLSGAHRHAMPKMLNWCSEASLVHWESASDALPAWEEAEERLRSEGRTNRLRYPSSAHVRGETLPQ